MITKKNNQYLCVKLLQKNPELINSLNRNIIYPFIQEYAFIAATTSDIPQLQEFEHE